MEDKLARQRARRKEYNKKYWAEHAKEISEKRRANNNHLTAYKREWYKTHKEYWNEYCRAYRRKQKEQRERAERAAQVRDEESD